MIRAACVRGRRSCAPVCPCLAKHSRPFFSQGKSAPCLPTKFWLPVESCWRVSVLGRMCCREPLGVQGVLSQFYVSPGSQVFYDGGAEVFGFPLIHAAGNGSIISRASSGEADSQASYSSGRTMKGMRFSSPGR